MLDAQKNIDNLASNIFVVLGEALDIEVHVIACNEHIVAGDENTFFESHNRDLIADLKSIRDALQNMQS